MIGGVVGGVVAGLLLLKVAGLEFRMMHAVLAAVLSLASVFGDLFESAFKRRFAVKDSGISFPAMAVSWIGWTGSWWRLPWRRSSA